MFFFLCHGCFVGVHFQYHLHKLDSLLIFLLWFFLSSSSYVDFILNNLFPSLDFLHLCKIIIFKFIFCKLINVGYTLFNVISQNTVRSNLMLEIVRHDVNKMQIVRA